MGLFQGLQISLDLGSDVNFKKKAELKKKIVENGGTISYIVTKKCQIVVTGNPEKCDVSSKCRLATKYGLSVLRLDYIWDSLSANKLLPYDYYVVGGKSKLLDFKSGKISASQHREKPKKYSSKPAFNPKSVKVWPASDLNQPWFDEKHYEVAKYAIFMGYSSSMKCQYTVVLELHSPPFQAGHNDKSETEMDENKSENQFVYRVVCQSGCHQDLEAGKSCHKEVRYLKTAEQALAVFAMLHEDVERKGELTKCMSPVRSIGSEKLQKLMAEIVDVSSDCSEEVKELVDHIWREAISEITSLLGDIKKIKMEQVEKAEAVLVKVRDALKCSAPEKKIQDLINEFYSVLPHVAEIPNMKDTRRWLTKKQDMCQLIKDIVSVSEMTNYETRAYVEAKYAALRCRITLLSGDKKLNIENLVKSSLESPIQNLQLLNVFEVWRWTEDVDFRRDLDRQELLFHSSKVDNFVGILSRGLLLPKIVVDDFGGQRTDAGMLGSGIYFASAASTSIKYSTPSKTKGSRLLLVNEVALGSCKDFTKHDTSLVAPPDGYQSTHGVSRKWENSSEFEDDEFVVYSVNQQRIRYLVEFTMQEDVITPLETIDPVDAGVCEGYERASLSDVEGISDPLLKVKAGLVGTGDKEVELRCVHIRAKLVDLASQVVVLQEYYNNSQKAIEAKYVFPLDDAAAVCGFEAFINGKHVVGEVKEKEVAHKEYKQAISEGHGAYLMDQDEETPDMFTVSVGNLPPGACVLIKITYVAELLTEDEKISFRLPAAVAPWKEESALKQSTQKMLASYKMSVTTTTIHVAVEMPFDIRSLHCPTHKIRVKQTASKAYVEMVKGQEFGAGFQLLIGLAEIHVPRMWVERHREVQEHQACMLTFYPEFETSEDTDGEILLALDVSNSMKENALLEAKKVALLIFQNLPTGWNFNVIRFGSDYEEVFPAPRKNTTENLQTAIQFVQNSIANKGNTDIMRLLRPLFLLPRTEKQRNVFLISDGHINDGELALHRTKQDSRHTRLFCFGISDTCNAYTLKALSRVSGGAFEHFNSKMKSKWEPKVKSQISKARQPGLTSVNVEWHQYNDNLPPTVQAPRQVTALFSGCHQIVYGFVPDCTMATLTAEVDGQKVSTVVSTSELSITEGLLVHRLTAKAIIRDWNDGLLSRDRTEHEVTKMDLKNYIVDLSKEYSIVTQFTSFIAVEKRDESEKYVPKEGPTIEELVKQENVDCLHYMGWTQEPQPTFPVIEAPFEGDVIFSTRQTDTLYEENIKKRSRSRLITALQAIDNLVDSEDSEFHQEYISNSKKTGGSKPQMIVLHCEAPEAAEVKTKRKLRSAPKIIRASTRAWDDSQDLESMESETIASSLSPVAKYAVPTPEVKSSYLMAADCYSLSVDSGYSLGDNLYRQPPPTPSFFRTTTELRALTPSGFGTTTGLGAPTPSGFGTTTGLGAPTPSGFGTTAGFGAPTPSGFGTTTELGAPTPSGFGTTTGLGAPTPSGFGTTTGLGAPTPSGFGTTTGLGAPTPSGFGTTTGLGAPTPSGFRRSTGFEAPTSTGFGAPPLADFAAPPTLTFRAPAFDTAPTPAGLRKTAASYNISERVATFGGASPSGPRSSHFSVPGSPAKFRGSSPTSAKFAVVPALPASKEAPSVVVSGMLGAPRAPVLRAKPTPVPRAQPAPVPSPQGFESLDLYEAPLEECKAPEASMFEKEYSLAAETFLLHDEQILPGGTRYLPSSEALEELKSSMFVQPESSEQDNVVSLERTVEKLPPLGEPTVRPCYRKSFRSQKCHYEMPQQMSLQSFTRSAGSGTTSSGFGTISSGSSTTPTSSGTPSTDSDKTSSAFDTSSGPGITPSRFGMEVFGNRPLTKPDIVKSVATFKEPETSAGLAQTTPGTSVTSVPETTSSPPVFVSHFSLPLAPSSSSPSTTSVQEDSGFASYKNLNMKSSAVTRILSRAKNLEERPVMTCGMTLRYHAEKYPDMISSFFDVENEFDVNLDKNPVTSYFQDSDDSRVMNKETEIPSRRKIDEGGPAEKTGRSQIIITEGGNLDPGLDRTIQFQTLEEPKLDFSLSATGIFCVRDPGFRLRIENFDILLVFQTKRGSWELGIHLDRWLKINSKKCREILVAKGLRSLGRIATQHIEELIATAMVLFSITELLKPDILPGKATVVEFTEIVKLLEQGFDGETWRKFNIPPVKLQLRQEAVKRGLMFCSEIERMHPCIYSILELGTNLVNVAAAFMLPKFVK